MIIFYFSYFTFALSRMSGEGSFSAKPNFGQQFSSAKEALGFRRESVVERNRGDGGGFEIENTDDRVAK